MVQKGISLAAIQKILGHDRLGTTAIYLNLTTPTSSMSTLKSGRTLFSN
jgi:site-specific recombinase XerD